MEDWLRNEEYRERERIYVEEYNRRLYETIPLFFSIRVLAIFLAVSRARFSARVGRTVISRV